MTRRSFIKQAGATAATGGAILGAPAIVSAQQQVRWRMASSFPKSLDTLYGAADELTQTPPRQPDWKDWAMDTAGAAFGVAALANFRRKKSLPAE